MPRGIPNAAPAATVPATESLTVTPEQRGAEASASIAAQLGWTFTLPTGGTLAVILDMTVGGTVANVYGVLMDGDSVPYVIAPTDARLD